MIASKIKISENTWIVKTTDGNVIKVVCQPNQTPEEVLLEAEIVE